MNCIKKQQQLRKYMVVLILNLGNSLKKLDSEKKIYWIGNRSSCGIKVFFFKLSCLLTFPSSFLFSLFGFSDGRILDLLES